MYMAMYMKLTLSRAGGHEMPSGTGVVGAWRVLRGIAYPHTATHVCQHASAAVANDSRVLPARGM